MAALTDRQRLELAIPAYLLYTLTAVPGLFAPVDPALSARAAADITALRANLQTACLEPFTDLEPKKRLAILRRLERVAKRVTANWADHSALSIVLTLWYMLKDLIDREILILWEGSAMDAAMRKLLPMFEYGFSDPTYDAVAQAEAGQLLVLLQAEGLYC